MTKPGICDLGKTVIGVPKPGDEVTYSDRDGTHTAHVLYVTKSGTVVIQRDNEIIYRLPKHLNTPGRVSRVEREVLFEVDGWKLTRGPMRGGDERFFLSGPGGSKGSFSRATIERISKALSDALENL